VIEEKCAFCGDPVEKENAVVVYACGGEEMVAEIRPEPLKRPPKSLAGI